MRHAPSLAEQKLWSRLRAGRFDERKWRRQHEHGWFILDFYCHELRLAVEIDGESHDHSVEYDSYRTAELAREGIHVVRFQNEHALFELDAVLRTLWRECLERREFLNTIERPLP